MYCMLRLAYTYVVCFPLSDMLLFNVSNKQHAVVKVHVPPTELVGPEQTIFSTIMLTMLLTFAGISKSRRAKVN